MLTTLLIFDQEVSDSLVLGQECLGNRSAGMGGVVDGRIPKFSLSVRVNPVAQGSLARTRASTSSPGTMAMLPL